VYDGGLVVAGWLAGGRGGGGDGGGRMREQASALLGSRGYSATAADWASIITG